MRPLLNALLLAALVAVPSGAATLDLPVHYPGDSVAPPCYRGDAIELRLAAPAARAAAALRSTRRADARPGSLGIASLDALAAALGGATFELEFEGTAPSTGESDVNDLGAYQVVYLPAGTRLEDALDRFHALPEVANAGPIAIMPVSMTPNDSLFARQQWLRADALPRHDIRASEAWDFEQGDSSIIVGVLDTGVLASHPDLGGTQPGGFGNLFVNRAEAGGLAGVDDDGNGFIDDISGWDFVDSTSVTAGEDGRGKDNDPSDMAGHGTALAGIIAAITNNASGVAGAAPRVRILPVRCGYSFGVRPAGAVDMLAAARSIAYATRMGASVVNCSWESVDQGGLGAAVTAAVRAGVTIANASGNRLSAQAYLGIRDDVIAVAGVDSTDVIWPLSTRGIWVDLVAQSVDMTSTFVQGTGPDSVGYRQPDYHSGLAGTSFAAPQVAAAAALVHARRRRLGLDPLTSIGMVLRLRDTSDDVHEIGNNAIYGASIGAGRLNMFRALTDPPTSTATRTRARTVGPAVLLQYNAGPTRVVYATSDQHLLALDGVEGDTLWLASLTATPMGNLAGGLLGPGAGVGLFVGTSGGTVQGFDDRGVALPGWPRTGLGLAASMSGGVALGDLDGDGVLEVVCAGSDGRVWAWRYTGALLPGFPFVSGVVGAQAPALADLDGLAGDEILFGDGTGALHALRFDGSELAGWPLAAASGARAPVVMRMGHSSAPRVVRASTGVIEAFDASGANVWSRAYTGAAAQDPVLLDLDGDGADEVLLASSGPAALSVRDSIGAPIARGGWPLSVGAAPAGALVAGPLRAGQGPCVGWFTTSGFIAYDDGAHAISTIPRPGLAGISPSLGDLDGDGATELALGASNSDSSIYAFDAGPATWHDSLAHWRTVRGDFARTGSHLHAATNGVIDVIRPAAVTNLLAQPDGPNSVRLSWNVTGDDSLTGRAAEVDLRYFGAPPTAATFLAGTRLSTVAPDTSGSPTDQVYAGGGFVEGQTYWFALRVRDDAGNWSALSNADSAGTVSTSPARITDFALVSLRDTTARFTWSATGEDGAVGVPAFYEVAASNAALDSLNFDAVPIVVQLNATRAAGQPESLSVHALERGHVWHFAVRATDHAGARSRLSNVVDVLVPIGGVLAGRQGVAVVARVRPSRVPVTLVWQADPGAPGQDATLTLHDISGRVLRRVSLGREAGGEWNWDGRDGESRLLPAGLYFARLVSGSRHSEARVVLLR